MAFSIERLTRDLAITPEQAEKIRDLIRGRILADDESLPKTARWIASCYHRPDLQSPETIMHAIDEVLETSGTEAIFADNWAVTRPVMEYCNAGDTYAPTIVYDYPRGRYLITTYGDWVERYGRRYELY